MSKRINKIYLSVIVPVYNEGTNITKFIYGLESSVNIKHEVLIIYDFDEDNTMPVVKRLKRKFKNIKLIKNIFESGLINACKTGFKKANGNFLVVMSGDLADEPKTINKMYELAKKGYDIVCATRYSKGGKQLGGSLVKTYLSKFAGLTTPILLGIPTSDLTNGFKMYNRKIFKKIKIESQGGWEFTMEILIKAHFLGFKITETPSTWYERTLGKSKFKLLKWLPKYIYWYFWGISQRSKLLLNR
ncbi:MAG: family 2 glycosyl transferase [Microgenomates group bacterium Gr01-1014_7]|nr:MAG: family 2 glycosyl transferase [Microgenomates group bacterium Gr01-1014_7]